MYHLCKVQGSVFKAVRADQGMYSEMRGSLGAGAGGAGRPGGAAAALAALAFGRIGTLATRLRSRR